MSWTGGIFLSSGCEPFRILSVRPRQLSGWAGWKKAISGIAAGWEAVFGNCVFIPGQVIEFISVRMAR